MERIKFLRNPSGGGGGGGYVSPNIGLYEDATKAGTMNAIGANGPVSGGGMFNYGGGSPTNYPAASSGNGGMFDPKNYSPASYGSGSSGYGTSGQYTAPSTPSNGSFNLGSYGSQLGSPQKPPMSGGSQFGSGGTYANKGPGVAAPSARTPYTPSASAAPAKPQGPNFSNVGSPLGGAAGLNVATSPYDFNPINQAISGLSNTPKFSQTYTPTNYNPYQFNFGQLPDQYTKDAYQSGASTINQTGNNQLSQLQESMGTRRPGLLMKASEDTNRDTSKNLSGLATQLNLNRINQNLDLSKAQQAAQAGENMNAANFNAGEGYKGYQSQSDLEKSNASNGLNYLQALQNAGTQKIGTQSGLMEGERNYQQQMMDYLMKMYQAGTGQANTSAQIQNQKNAGTMGALQGLGSLGVGIAGLF